MTDKMGADAIIGFVNASKTVKTDMQILRRRARVVLVGLFGGALQLQFGDNANEGLQANWLIFRNHDRYYRASILARKRNN